MTWSTTSATRLAEANCDAVADVRYEQLCEALLTCDVGAKQSAVAALATLDLESALRHPADPTATLAAAPGRPDAPALVHPRDVAQRGLGSERGRIGLLHAIAHIEFNAINLALDAALRFPGMPADYYADWCSVAVDEARHFSMLRDRLHEYGADYGELPAHNGLWEMAEKTAHDPLHRMALVPRVLEARGLDVTPGMIERLEQAGDQQSADILRVILEEEVRHVAIGTRWYRFLCASRGLDADATFAALLKVYGVQLHPPFNDAAREQAGFSADELPRGGR